MNNVSALGEKMPYEDGIGEKTAESKSHDESPHCMGSRSYGQTKRKGRSEGVYSQLSSGMESGGRTINMKDLVLETMGKAWMRHKSSLYSKYVENLSAQGEKMPYEDGTISKGFEAYKANVTSPELQVQSKTTSESKSHDNCSHSMGSGSFAQNKQKRRSEGFHSQLSTGTESGDKGKKLCLMRKQITQKKELFIWEI